MNKTLNLTAIALAVGAAFFLGMRFGISQARRIEWDAYERGACRAAVYTFEHKLLPSMAFRELAFEMPDSATDDEIEAAARARYSQFQRPPWTARTNAPTR